MGIAGTDVAKDAADMVLVDDNFATIVAAVEEGRVIYDNIRKFIVFLIGSNAAELWVMLLGPVFGLPTPLLPLQILWINLVTDGPAALALAFEPAEADAMRRPPRRPDEPILTRRLAWRVVWVGALIAILPIAEAVWAVLATVPLQLAVVYSPPCSRSSRRCRSRVPNWLSCWHRARSSMSRSNVRSAFVRGTPAPRWRRPPALHKYDHLLDKRS
jgi:magnesium-transporting ATPase (P-type)